MELNLREMEAGEENSFSDLAEESSKTVESFVQIFDDTVRDPAIIFSHNSGCSAPRLQE